MILVYFPTGGCVDDVVNNRTNHQFNSVIAVHFINRARVFWIIKRTVFNVYVCTKVFFANGKIVLYVAFIKYTLLYTKL